MKLPSEAEAIELLKKYNDDKHVENLIRHSKAVSAFAEDIAKKLTKKGHNIDIEAVKIAGFVHDVGKSTRPGPAHSLASGEILRKEGFPELASIVEKHGLSKECAEEEGKSGEEFIAKTLEEKVLCFADAHFEMDKKIHWTERVPLLEKRWKKEHLAPVYKAQPRFTRTCKEIEKMLED